MQRLLTLVSIPRNQKIFSIIGLIVILAAGIVIHAQLWHHETRVKEDIYYSWVEGQRILSGENPYSRILSGNIRENAKYATYFPLFYLLSTLTQFLGWRDYSKWIYLWRHIFLLFNIGIASLIFYIFYQYRLFVFAIFATLFWLFNRWTLHVTEIAHLEFIPIFFLISSLMIFRKNNYISLLLFSISLALKQIAVFLLPLYLIWFWQSTENEKSRKTLIALGVILSVPVLTSLPFIILNSDGFFKSILFSATRNPEGHFKVDSLDTVITSLVPEFVGIKAKLPMLVLMALTYFSALKRQIGMYVSSLIVMTVFVDFNSVLFRQYMCWLVPLLPLAICDFVESNREIAREKRLESTH